MIRLIISISTSVVVSAVLTQTSFGQDFVIHQTPGKPPVRRQGTIADWKGITLQLEQAGRTHPIDGSTVIAIETQWPDGYQKGLDELARKNFPAAIDSFQNAARREPRPWARNIIWSEVLRCQLATENLPGAADTFFQIIATDPQTRFVPLCPLRWAGNDTTMNQQAADWINSEQPIVQLLGASWLIGTNAAASVLENLARDIDPSVAGLAVGQLWNRRKSKMTPAELDVWLKKIETMPIAIRSGPRFAIAQAQDRSGLADQAISNYMRVVILHPEQPLLSARSLYLAANLLNDTNRTTAAQTLIEELKTKHPNSSWASR